jgi:chemotaxis protein CheC
MTAPALSGEKLDALQELVNIGMGAAGAALAKALGAFVELTVPAVDFTDRRSVAGLLDAGPWADHEVEAVRQPFFGAFTGESLMIFDEQVHAQLADLLGYGEAPGGEPISMGFPNPPAMMRGEQSSPAPHAKSAAQQEMLLDLANVVIGACVNNIAEPIHEVVSFGPPAGLGTRADVRTYLLQEAVACHQGLIVNLDFKLEARSFLSRVLVFLPEHSLQRIDQALTQLLDGLAAS